jgi:hypothetical protein
LGAWRGCWLLPDPASFVSIASLEFGDYAITHAHNAAYPNEFAYDDEYTSKVTDANEFIVRFQHAQMIAQKLK